MATLSGHVGLHSVERGDLAVTITATELRRQNFHTASIAICNSLPDHL